MVKVKINTNNKLSIDYKDAIFIYCPQLSNGRRNDREQWTGSELYMSYCDYFSPGERVASDGGFRGDGLQLISYKVLDTAVKQ